MRRVKGQAGFTICCVWSRGMALYIVVDGSVDTVADENAAGMTGV